MTKMNSVTTREPVLIIYIFINAQNIVLICQLDTVPGAGSL